MSARTSLNTGKATTTRTILATLTLVFAGNLQAFAADTQPHAQPRSQSREQLAASGEGMDGRPDWNVDYPSQLGPQPVHSRTTKPSIDADAVAPSKPVNGGAPDSAPALSPP